MNNNEITVFAQTNFRNQARKFGIKTDDRRRHTYLIGKTGMGKSVTLENMIIQDIIAGKGLCVVDPHGELVEKVIKFIPPSRINDVVYINPADLSFPIAFNVLESVSEEHRHLVASGLLGIFKKLWAESWGPRLEYVLNNAIMALLEYPGSTLLGVMRLLIDKSFRKKVINKITDPIIKSFWVEEYSKYPDRFQAEAIAPIQNKVGRFLSSALIRNILGQVKSSFSMRDIMDEEKILLLNLSKGRIGEDNSALLGAMIITKIQLAAMSRVDMSEKERKDFYLYVDEFQNFATESFANILSEARKYRLNLIIAHQYIEQVEENVQAAVFGNVGTLVVFRVGAADAEFLEKEFFPTFTQEDLVNLSKFEIYIKLMIDGVTSEAFSARTLPPVSLAEENLDTKDKIISVTRERYARPREVIEDKIIRWSENRGVEETSKAKATATLTGKNNSDQKNRKKKETGISHDAVCDLCGKKSKINFDPDPTKPIYCRECLDLSRAGKVPPPSSIKIISDDGREEEFTSLAEALKGRKVITKEPPMAKTKSQSSENVQPKNNGKKLNPGEIV